MKPVPLIIALVLFLGVGGMVADAFVTYSRSDVIQQGPGYPDVLIAAIPLYQNGHMLSKAAGNTWGLAKYLVNAQPERIEAYYKEELAQLGWQLESNSDSGTVDGNMVFFSTGASSSREVMIYTGELRVQTKLTASGETDVELLRTGAGVETWLANQH